MSLLKIYIALAKKGFLPSPLLGIMGFALVLFINNSGLELVVVMFPLVIALLITEKEYNLLFTLPMKTQDILKLKYINSYVQVILGFILGGVGLAYKGELELGYFIYKLSVVIIELNILLFLNSDRGLRNNKEDGALLIPALMVMIAIVFYYLGIESDKFNIVDKSIMYSAGIVIAVFSCFNSYKKSNAIVYGEGEINYEEVS
ncbi:MULTISPECIES: hypothetical protein [Clostridium]|uniref:hypothetical protein n=1 Tax=Clostridium TaxID=1485 RepID=UPI001897E707|nr:MULTISPECIES: hypothetical protein [Clostridium]MDB2123106.1 hypothetical protein [Clostridium paraputrificum]MDU1586628.1 hypothetical protein [Clostridium sp.]MDU1977762.1 hypothetical protein [Clostridium sp.]MDU1993759.1 hypothetical protein [Clostridium sp.]MDU6047793.1 hypothetical protein [Clostridium sp.]